MATTSVTAPIKSCYKHVTSQTATHTRGTLTDAKSPKSPRSEFSLCRAARFLFSSLVIISEIDALPTVSVILLAKSATPPGGNQNIIRNIFAPLQTLLQFFMYGHYIPYVGFIHDTPFHKHYVIHEKSFRYSC